MASVGNMCGSERLAAAWVFDMSLSLVCVCHVCLVHRLLCSSVLRVVSERVQ